MFVWFVDPVPKAKRAALVKMAPKLCRLDAQWPNGQLLWPSTGDRWIQQHFVAEYGTAAAKKKMAKAQSEREAVSVDRARARVDDLRRSGSSRTTSEQR